MTLRPFVLLTLAAASLIGPAAADEAVSLTPPLYREQARSTAAMRRPSELATTPRLVPAAPAAPKVVAAAVPTR
jgi:hypothetical protein